MSESRDRVKDVTLIVWDVMQLEKFDVFVLKRSSAMMGLLIVNVCGHAIQMRM